MSKIYLLIAWFVLGFNCLCLADKQPKGFHEVKSIKKNFVQVKPNLFACKYETCNADYQAFLNNVKNRMNAGVYQSLLPDTNNWLKPGTYNAPYQKYYHTHPAYAQYPVVNISYEQANFYCTWLTQQYNSNPKRAYKKVVFKLPSRAEWTMAANGGDTANAFPWGRTMAQKPKKMAVNYCEENYTDTILKDTVVMVNGKLEKRKDTLTIHYDCNPHHPFVMYASEVYWKSAKQTPSGLFHIAGNVSEMVSGKGDCMGGNFNSHTDWLRTDAPNEFYPGYLPCPFIGFRVFMQVLEE